MTVRHRSGRLQCLVLRVAFVVSSCGLSQSAAASTDEPPIARVRSTDAALSALIDRATEQSATFQRLLASIERSHGIVYVEAGTCSHAVRACLQMWMTTSGPNRFLRVVIDRRRRDSDVDVMAAIGHELQHAVEALSESGTTDGIRLYNFFQRFAPTPLDRFETTDALRAGDNIQNELRARKPE